jgi:hypothetical protein
MVDKVPLHARGKLGLDYHGNLGKKDALYDEREACRLAASCRLTCLRQLKSGVGVSKRLLSSDELNELLMSLSIFLSLDAYKDN